MKESEAFTFIQRTAMSERTTHARGRRADPRRLAAAELTATRWRSYLLVDGNSLTYRAFFALPTDMATASGQVTNAVFGFTSMLINVLKDQKPDGVLVAFDRPEPTFRHDADPDTRPTRGGARHPAPADGARAPGARRAAGSSRSSCRVGRPTTSSPPPSTCSSRAATTSSSSPATATATSSSPTRTSGCSTTGAASATTRCTTRPASRRRPAYARRCTRSTRRCAATRATTCPACRASARRPPPS